MKFTIEKEKLIEGLQQVQNIIPSRTTLPILQNTLIETTDKGITLSTTDLDVGISCPVEATVETPGQTTLPARRLFTIIRELPATSVEIEVDGKNVASIRSGQSFFKIMGLPREEFPPFPNLENARELKMDQVLLRDMIRKTAYAISHDETRYVLNGIFLTFKDKKLCVVATDGRRLALSEAEMEFAKGQETDMILPTKAVNELQRLLGDTGEIVLQVAESRVAFTLNNTYVVTKLTDGNYPNYKQVIPPEAKERVTLERETFLNTLKRVSLLTSDKSSSIKLTFGKDNLTLLAITPDVGEARESLPVKYRGKEFSIAFNPEYLMDPLRNLANDEIHFDFVDELSPGVMRISNASFLYVIMPMRLS